MIGAGSSQLVMPMIVVSIMDGSAAERAGEKRMAWALAPRWRISGLGAGRALRLDLLPAQQYEYFFEAVQVSGGLDQNFLERAAAIDL